MSYYEIVEKPKKNNLDMSKYLHSEPTPLQTPYVFEIKLEKIDGNINTLRIIKKSIKDNSTVYQQAQLLKSGAYLRQGRMQETNTPP